MWLTISSCCIYSETHTPTCVFFFFNDTAPTEIYTVSDTLSLHDALPISDSCGSRARQCQDPAAVGPGSRSEEHTSELQSPDTISYAVFCLKKKKNGSRQWFRKLRLRAQRKSAFATHAKSPN